MKQKSIDYARQLNPAQLEAVQSTSGPHLVIAGAGSGKTRVLVYRVAYLVEHGTRPDQILLLTFTRRAAQEMLRRASALLDDRCFQVAGGTFHSFANLILRRYAQALGLPNNFTILDQSDAQDTINLIRTNKGLHKAHKRFPRKAALLEVISKSVNKSQGIERILDEEYPQFIEWEREISGIRDAYAAYKKQNGLLDYDDLLVYLRDLLVSREDIRARLSRAYKYIMVDEYQDTNRLQAYIACLLASEHKNIMVVGDDAQSIYSFRGADFRNIIDFPTLFPGTRQITLEENYRSTQPILDLTNAVISQAREKFDKKLFTRNRGSRVPAFVEVRDEHAQSRFVADKILSLREEGVELGQMAVLFRSGWHSNDLEVELASRNIPFVKFGGSKFVEAAHIKDIMAYLRIAHNLKDEVSWYRALLLEPGIGPKKAQAFIAQACAPGIPLAEIPAAGGPPEVLRLVGLLRDVIRAGVPPQEMIRIFLEYYQTHLREKYDDYHRRANDLDSLMRIAERYRSLESFLTDMALEPPDRSIVEAGRKDADDSTLTLSTMHSAKGLEWRAVFLIFIAEGHMPSYLSLEDEGSIEEERRLFYVAATRAKEDLFIVKPHLDRGPRGFMDDGGRIFTQMSRFLDEGDIVRRFTDVQAGPLPAGEYAHGPSIDEIVDDELRADPRFLEMMRDYFRHDDP